MTSTLENVAVCILGERVDNQAPLVILTRAALTEVTIRVMGPRGEAVESVRVGDVAAYSVTRRVLNLGRAESYVVHAAGYDHGLGPYAFPSPEKVRKVGVVCCDAHWHLPVRQTWHDLERETEVGTVFHIGDQIYHDLRFSRMMNFLRSVRGREADYMAHAHRLFVDNYIESWSMAHKRGVLGDRHNVMLGDDHEITDDMVTALPNAGRSEFESLKAVAISVYRLIQGGLRANPLTAQNDFHTAVVGSTLYLMMGRMYNMVQSVDDCVTFVDSVINDPEVMGSVRTVALLMSKPPLNKSALLPYMSHSRFAQLDFSPLYQRLFRLRDRMGKRVILVGGDLHVLYRWEIRPTAAEPDASLPPPITLTSIPAMASCVITPPMPVNAGLPDGCGFTGTQVSRARVNGFAVIDTDSGEVRCVTRRFMTHYLRNECYVGLKALWAMFTVQRLNPNLELLT